MNLLHYCNFGKFILPALLIGFFCFLTNLNISESYYFGLKSADDSPWNIKKIEESQDIKLPIVSFIFDPREENDVLNTIDKIIEILGKDRIYHFTISPGNLSATDVAEGKFDDQYIKFFEKIKEKNLHVIFRTMHEMNGGRYPRSSNPKSFKNARIHVWSLSKITGLDEENILFDFSINHRDMPTKEKPSQSAKLIECNILKKGCYHFEDYYPGDEYVDVVGFTFYNRGKAVGNRKWLTPIQILYDKNRNTYKRIKALKKPIIIDEVATTSVRYEGEYDYNKSRNAYLNHDELKNNWIYQLREFLVNRPEIVAAIYFNTDYTHGLNFQITGEADWAIVNVEDNKVYGGFQELEMFGEKDLDNILSSLFHLNKIEIDGNKLFISQKCTKEINIIISALNKKENNQKKAELVKSLQNLNIKSDCIKRYLSDFLNLYEEIQIESTNK